MPTTKTKLHKTISNKRGIKYMQSPMHQVHKTNLKYEQVNNTSHNNNN